MSENPNKRLTTDTLTDVIQAGWGNFFISYGRDSVVKR